MEETDYLKYDVTNIAHHIRQNARILVIGTGGGRDVLSALVFGQKAIVGVEINNDIIKTVNRRYGDFTGHLDRYANVTFVNDEARSYIARSPDAFDIIQASLVDTWAATASGAFVLTENSLYTVEAWKIFIEHLTPDGVLTFSRWYFQENPAEIYRLISLATDSLIRSGIKKPQDHIVMIRNMRGGWYKQTQEGIGTILVSRSPFSDGDMHMLEEICRTMNFDIVLSPRFALDPIFARIATGESIEELPSGVPINIAAPTDDSPFFFHMLRLSGAFSRQFWKQGALSFNIKAIFVLGVILITVIALTFLCIIVPLIMTTAKSTLNGSLPLFVFFSGIGFGFMLIEISQMQRLIVFLGHPTYGLSVVLFSLLLSSGMGSYLSEKISIVNNGFRGAALMLLLLVCVLIVFGTLTPYAIEAFQGSMTFQRILVSAGILSGLGLFMGMAFPIGMTVAAHKSALLTPWLWGINGSTSVCASVFAVVIGLNWGITTTFWTGFMCYAIAFISFLAATRKLPSSSVSV